MDVVSIFYLLIKIFSEQGVLYLPLVKDQQYINMMKYIFLLFSLFTFSQGLVGQGMQFFEGTFEQALELAKQEGKLIFVDAYASWCGPCKRMKTTVFPERKAGEFYNKHFVNMAIDMEKQMGLELNKKFNVRAYPTFLFIDSDGKIIFREVGGKTLDLFIQMGTEALKKDDKTADYEKQYKEGSRDYVFMLNYVKSLNRVGKPASAIIYEYFSSGPSLTVEQKANIIFEGTTHCDSKLFDQLTSPEIKKNIIETRSEDVWDQKMYDVCWATASKGFEFNVPELIEEAKAKYRKFSKGDAKKFSLEVDLDQAQKTINPDAYLKAAEEFVKILKSPKEKIDFILNMKNTFLQHKGIGEYSESFLVQLAKKEKSIEGNLGCAKILLLNKKYEESRPYLEAAQKMAEEKSDGEKLAEVKKLISSVDRMTGK